MPLKKNSEKLPSYDAVESIKKRLATFTMAPNNTQLTDLFQNMNEKQKKSVQHFLIYEQGYNLGATGIHADGVDGNIGPLTKAGLMGYWLFNVYLKGRQMNDYNNEKALKNEFKSWNGDRMRLIQKFLQANGIYLPRYGADGYFGAETYKGILTFTPKEGVQEKKIQVKNKVIQDTKSLLDTIQVLPKRTIKVNHTQGEGDNKTSIEKKVAKQLEDVNAVIDSMFMTVLKGKYDKVKKIMKAFVQVYDVSAREVALLCWLWRGENQNFSHTRKNYTVIGQVGRDAWQQAFNDLGVKHPPIFNTRDYANSMLASYVYAKRCGLFRATTNLSLGKAFMRYNLGSYTSRAMKYLPNQAVLLRKKVLLAAGLNPKNFSEWKIKKYMSIGAITKEHVAMGEQMYYMPHGITTVNNLVDV